MHNDFSLLENHRKLAVANLKRCPLCGTVNSKLNPECFVCRWHGDFDQNADSVEEGLIDVLEHCPELIDCILYAPRRESLYDRVRHWLKRRAHTPLDFEA